MHESGYPKKRSQFTFVWVTLGVAFLVLAVAEQDRDWKRIQAEYRDLELDRLRGELAAERQRSATSRGPLESELEEARRRFESQSEEARRLEKDLLRARHGERWAAAELDRMRRRAPAERDLRAARRHLEERRRTAADLEERLVNLRRELDAAEARRDAALTSEAELEQRIERLAGGAFLRRIPGLRGIDPTLSVVELAPPGIFRTTAAGSVERRDRCMTCHLGAGRPRGELDATWPAPFAAHPGEMVGPDSPHRPTEIGCTVCHGGNGRATDFSRAGHWPTSPGQEAEWSDRWGFSRRAAVRDVILPTTLVEATCVECHETVPSGGEATAERVGDVDRVSRERGRILFRRMGCAGCHASEAARSAGGLTRAVKRGPPLHRLADKTTSEWTFHWIVAPRNFRSSTWMPHLVPGDADSARRNAVVAAMVRYLWQRPGAALPAPPAGDAAEGQRLFATIGCTGCHLLDAEAVRDEAPPERLHAPNLARSGNKLRPGWLYRWLLEPRSHRDDTPMPDLRLSDEEAADLVAYLMADRDEAWQGLEIPTIDATVRDELVRELLEDELTLADSAARLDRMNAGEKDLYLGRRSLETYGCHGCHEVPGLEAAAAPGQALDAIGEDPRRLLDEDGAAVLAHRSGRGPAPDYGMSRREADAVRVHLLSSRATAARPGRGDGSSLQAAGRRLLERYGCLGCHGFEGRGGGVAEEIPAGAPPELTTIGARLAAPWLFAYLNDPGRYARRPWLGARMPSFHLLPEEANLLVRFFAARGAEPLFEAPLPEPARRDVELGRAVADMLQCDRCHAGSPDVRRLSPGERAPSYRGARSRLRPQWVVEWILDPRRFEPNTTMPSTFSRGAGGGYDASYLMGTISSPMFNAQRKRLVPLFDSEEALFAYLSDARRVSAALRDYLWTLEE